MRSFKDKILGKKEEEVKPAPQQEEEPSTELKNIKKVQSGSTIVTKAQIEAWNQDLTTNIFHCNSLTEDKPVVLIIDKVDCILLDEYTLLENQPSELPLSKILSRQYIGDMVKISADPRQRNAVSLHFDFEGRDKIGLVLNTEEEKKHIVYLMMSYHNS